MSDTTLPTGDSPLPLHETGSEPFQAGDRVGGRYTIEERIGVGGMGVVYRARQDLTQKLVAIKVIRHTWSRGPLLERFLEEIRLLGRLDHHGLVSIHDADLHRRPDGDDVLFFTMDLIDGSAITSWARHRDLDRSGRIALMVRVCEAVQYAHDHGVIHCDLKPGNVLVRRTGDPVVIDFGLAYLRSDTAAVDVAAALADEAAGSLTRGFGGTPSYMSPEQFQGGVQELRAGQSVDVYALGVVTFELLTGQLPYDLPEAFTLHDIRRAVLFTPPRKLIELVPDVPPDLDRAVAKCLRKDPADRYYSVAQFLRVLTRFLPSSAPATAPEWQPAQGIVIPSTNWILDDRLGEGGVGEVWTCHHRTLKHKRIVKFCADEEKASFLRRELTLYRLLKEKVGQNPHFARLEEVALEEPPRYLMSEYIEARDLAKWHAAHSAEAPIPQDIVLEIVAQAADALQAAHDAGVLHRDVKPSNLLVRGHPSDLGSLHVWVGDFGIGQVISDDVFGDATRSGFTRTLLAQAHSSYSGTHFYMAPELLAGEPASVRSDIYALGVVLYQALTGDFQRVVTIDWASDIPDPLLRADLERCFARNPASRFPSAGELSDRLRQLPERHAERERAAAAAAQRERRAYRRGLARAGMLAAAIIAGVSALAAYAIHKRNLADTQTALAEKQTKEAEYGQATTLLGEIKTLRSSAEPGKQTDARAMVKQLASIPAPPSLHDSLRNEAIAVQALSAIALAPVPSLDLDGQAWVSPGLRSALSKQPDGSLRRHRRTDQVWRHDDSLPTPPEAVSTFLISDSGETVAAWLAETQEAALYVDGSWRRLGGSGVTALTVADSGLAAVARPDGTIEIHRAGHPDGSVRVLGADRAAVATISTPRSAKRPWPPVRPAQVLAFDSNGNRLAAASRDSLFAMVWNVETGDLEAVARSLHPITAVAWNAEATQHEAEISRPDTQRMLATGAEDGTLVLWDLAARQGPVGSDHHLSLMPQPGMVGPDTRRRAVRHAVFAEAGRQLMALYDDDSLSLFDNQTGTFIDTMTGMQGATEIAVGRDRHLAMQTAAGRPSFRASRSSPVFEEVQMLFNSVSSVDSTKDGRLTLVRNPEATVLVGTIGLQPLHRFEPAFGHTARFVPDTDALMAIAGSQYFLWRVVQDRSTPRVIRYGHRETESKDFRKDPGDSVEMDVISLPDEDDTRLTAHARKIVPDTDEEPSVTITIQRTREPKDIELVRLPYENVRRLRLHPSGGWIAVIAREHAPATIVNIKEKSYAPLEGLPSRFLDVAFSPDGRFLALRDAKEVHVYSAQSRSSLFSFELPSRLENTAPIAFSQDSSLFVATGRDGLPKLYRVPADSVTKWQTVAELISPRPRDAVTFHFGGPGGACLLSGTADGYLQVWNIAILRKELKGLGLDWNGPEWQWPESIEPLEEVHFQ